MLLTITDTNDNFITNTSLYYYKLSGPKDPEASKNNKVWVY